MADPEFIEDCLKYHNVFRSLHNSPELVIDLKLNTFAQDWALTLADKDTLEHRQENDYGENLYVGFDSTPEWKLNPEEPVNAWYKEISNYKFGEPTPENVNAVGHFTQLVWKTSEKLGVGFAKSASGNVYVVCNYEPAGNVDGKFNENVLPPEDEEEGEKDRSKVKSASDLVNKKSQQSQASRSTTQKSKSTIKQKFRVLSREDVHIWSSWLSDVADTATMEWNEWLLAHIRLLARLLDYLRKAQEAINQKKSNPPDPCKPTPSLPDPCKPCPDPCESPPVPCKQQSSEPSRSCTELGKKASQTRTVCIQLSKQRSEPCTEPSRLLSQASQQATMGGSTRDSKGGVTLDADNLEKEMDEVSYDKIEGKGGKGRPSSAKKKKSRTGPGKTCDEVLGRSRSKTRLGSAGQKKSHESESSSTTASKTDKLGASSRSSSRASSSRASQMSRAKRLRPTMKLNLTMPGDECELMEIIKEFKLQAKKYRALYRYWKKMSEKVKEEIYEEPREASAEERSTHEEIPFFYFLEEEPDIESDSDDDITDCKTGREKIAYKNLNLFFNLTDDEPDKAVENDRSISTLEKQKSNKSITNKSKKSLSIKK